MAGCGPDPLWGCIPGVAVGSKMPRPLHPQFPHTTTDSVGLRN